MKFDLQMYMKDDLQYFFILLFVVSRAYYFLILIQTSIFSPLLSQITRILDYPCPICVLVPLHVGMHYDITISIEKLKASVVQNHII